MEPSVQSKSNYATSLMITLNGGLSDRNVIFGTSLNQNGNPLQRFTFDQAD